MSTLKTLVVGADGSAPSAYAVSWAAERTPPDGVLHLVHGLMAGHGMAISTTQPGPPQRVETITALEGRWSEPARPHRCRTVTHVVEADPADALLRVAGETRADAIVVGPHSSAIGRRSLGRVARALLQRSALPVVIPKAGEPTSRPKQARPVVACVGYGDATEQAALWASDYAAERGLPLSLLHVVGYRPIFPVDSPSDMLGYYFGPDVLKRWAAEDLEGIRERVAGRHPELTVSNTVDVGFASRAILKAGTGAELVVLGKRTENAALRYLISPRIHQLIAKSDATIAIVPSCNTEPGSVS